MSLWVHKSAIH